MKVFFKERNIVVLLFFMVLVTFSLAQEDSRKKMTMIYTGMATENTAKILTQLTHTNHTDASFLQPSQK